MKNRRKILSLILVLSLLFPSLVYAATLDADEDSRVTGVKLNNVEAKKSDSFNKKKMVDEFPGLEEFDGEETKDNYDEEEDVRIIVELKDKPSIVHATKENMRYKDMPKNKVDKIEREVLVNQEKVKKDIAKKDIQFKHIKSYKTIFNGFSGFTKYKNISIIEKIPMVKKVYISKEYTIPIPENSKKAELEMHTSNEMIGSHDIWDIGYKGEGSVVAILDTGVDPRHKDLILSEDTVPKLTEDDVERITYQKDLDGKYYTEKVPYGYNYGDENYDIIGRTPLVGEHGMHIAGTIGANGNVENGGIKGVAPETQILAMKIFSEGNSTDDKYNFNSTYPIRMITLDILCLEAMEDSVTLGADAINMSLGYDSGFFIEDSLLNVAVTNATRNGVVCAIAAGNSSHSTNGWEEYGGLPFKENPDYGIVAAPGVSRDSINIASIRNTHITTSYLTYNRISPEGEEREEVKVPMVVSSSLIGTAPDPGEMFEFLSPLEYVYCGLGMKEDYGLEVSGKIALVERGEIPFKDKIMNAQKAGAKAIIVFNDDEGGDEILGMMHPVLARIPAMFIGNSAGKEMQNLEEKLVSFNNDTSRFPYVGEERMSDFSSWGSTPSLELKPELTAPGEQIYSTLNNDDYGTMSGTSMATPHVAGGVALMKQFIREDSRYQNLIPDEQAKLAKVFLMNTADIIKDGKEVPYSPRKQGSGLMNLPSAVTTPVRVVDSSTKDAKVELKDFEDKSFTIDLSAINDSSEDVIYKVNGLVLTDKVIEEDGVELYSLGSRVVDADISEFELTVPAGRSKDFQVAVDFSMDSKINKNMFIDGYIILEDTLENHPTLSIPFMGFYGDWNEPSIFDGIKDLNEKSYFGKSGLLNGRKQYMEPGKAAINPKTKGIFKEAKNVNPVLSFMRNAEEVKYDIVDEEGNIVRKIITEKWVTKTSLGQSSIIGLPYSYSPLRSWNGKTSLFKVAADGQYYYRIRGKIHYGNKAEWQEKRIPVYVDTIAPEVSNLEYDKETEYLRWKATDEGIGIRYFTIWVNDEKVVQCIEAEDNKEEHTWDMNEILNGKTNVKIEVIAFDYASNAGVSEPLTIDDLKEPTIEREEEVKSKIEDKEKTDDNVEDEEELEGNNEENVEESTDVE